MTGQPEPVLGKWLDLYYQVRHAYEIERGTAEEPQLLRRDDLYGALREILKEQLGTQPKRTLPKAETVKEPKEPGPWVKMKRRILDKLRTAREAGVSIASIAAASGGVLTEHRVMDALNAAKLSQEEWRALDSAPDIAAAAASAAAE